MTTIDHTKISQLTEKFNISKIYAKKVLHHINKESSSTTSHRNLILKAQRLIEEKPKPFIKWVGGKRQLISQFREQNLYPPDSFDPINSNYFEPFLGGGAVFFDLLPEKAFLSDLNKELITTYKVIRDEADNLIHLLKKHKNKKDYFLKIRSLNPKTLSCLEIASRFIYLNRTCFNGLYRVNKKGLFNVPFGRYENPLICDKENLKKVSQSLKKIHIGTWRL